MSFKPPTFEGTAFTCPLCSAYAHMTWQRLFFHGSSVVATDAFTVICNHCNGRSYWLGKGKIPVSGKFADGVMIYPLSHSAPLPHAEMPEDIRTDYEEARDIAGKSPRAAAALLRLCVQKLCRHLGEPGDNINNDIGSLVKKGLPVEIQQALDIVRVVGNNSVHPGEIRTDDVAAVSTSLFDLVNYIVEDRIARPGKLSAMFSALPAPALARIAKRDKDGTS